MLPTTMFLSVDAKHLACLSEKKKKSAYMFPFNPHA